MKTIFMLVALGIASQADAQIQAIPQTPTTQTPTASRAALENPAHFSYASGIGLISGWACEASTIEVYILQRIVQDVPGGPVLREDDFLGPFYPAYGTARGDTLEECGDSNNGFGLLFNWNLLGNGYHAVGLWVNGVVAGAAVFTVTTLGREFVRDVRPYCYDFPHPFIPGQSVALTWEESIQGFVLMPPERCN